VSGERVVVQAPLPAVSARDGRLILAALAGPLAWLAQLGVGYGLVGPMCVARSRWWLHALTAAALACVGLGARHCWRGRAAPGDGAGDAARRAIAWGGVGLAAFFALLVVGVDVPGWLLDPCE